MARPSTLSPEHQAEIRRAYTAWEIAREVQRYALLAMRQSREDASTYSAAFRVYLLTRQDVARTWSRYNAVIRRARD